MPKKLYNDPPLGPGAPSPTGESELDSATLERIVEILEDDAFRRGGTVTYDRVLSLCSKHSLPPDAVPIVSRRLEARDVEIERPHADSVNDDLRGREAATGVTTVGRQRHEEEPSSEAAPPEAVRDILGAYFRSAGAVRRLSAQEEIALARRIHTGQSAAERLASGDPCDREELGQLVADGQRARSLLIEANLRLVPFVAKTVEGRERLPFDDLVQEGNLGLIRAAERFEGGHDARFSTYACWWIWSFMKRALIDRAQLVRVPVHIADRLPQLRRAQKALTRERDGMPPTVTELAEHLGWRVAHVIFALQSIEHPLHIEAAAGDGLPPLLERLAAPPESQPDVDAAHHEEERKLAELVDTLGERRAYVLRERFGLGGGVPKTLEEVAQQMDLTRERVRQIESKALDQLRHPSKRHFWETFGISPELRAQAAKKLKERKLKKK